MYKELNVVFNVGWTPQNTEPIFVTCDVALEECFLTLWVANVFLSRYKAILPKEYQF